MPNGLLNMDTVWESAGAFATGLGVRAILPRPTTKALMQRELIVGLGAAIGGALLSNNLPAGPVSNLVSGVGYGGATIAGERVHDLFRNTNSTPPSTGLRAPVAVRPASTPVARAAVSASRTTAAPSSASRVIAI